MSKIQNGTFATPPTEQWRSVDAVTGEAGVTLSGTAASRKVLDETGTTAAPSGAAAGFSIAGAEKLVVLLKATTAAYDVTLYEWDASSEEWAQNLVVGTQSVGSGDTLRFGAEVDGCHRAFLRVTSGSGGTIEGWARLIKREA